MPYAMCGNISVLYNMFLCIGVTHVLIYLIRRFFVTPIVDVLSDVNLHFIVQMFPFIGTNAV